MISPAPALEKSYKEIGRSDTDLLSGNSCIEHQLIDLEPPITCTAGAVTEGEGLGDYHWRAAFCEEEIS